MPRQSNGFKYTARSSSHERLLPLQVKPNKGSTMDYVYIVIGVLVFWTMVLIAYWGWIILLSPKLQALIHALGG